MATQIQMRGGTSKEHESFVGASREVTVDTTKNTLVVHDGSTVGGHPLAKSEELDYEINKVTERIADFEHNIGRSHNHDGLYSKLDHNHDGKYVREIEGQAPLYTRFVNSFHGFCIEGDDSNWVRTTRNGLIPYQSGGYSNIGTASWRFAEGWFNRVNTDRLIIPKVNGESVIEFPPSLNDPGYIKHIEHNNRSILEFCVSDDVSPDDKFSFGTMSNGHYTECANISADGDLFLRKGLVQNNMTIKLGGKQIYFNGERPWDAPEGSISFG